LIAGTKDSLVSGSTPGTTPEIKRTNESPRVIQRPSIAGAWYRTPTVSKLFVTSRSASPFSNEDHMKKPKDIKLKLDTNRPEGNLKPLGGSKADEWNNRLNDLTVNALPIAHSKNTEKITEAAFAVSYGTMDISPADPIEGMLTAQLMAANEAALSLYRRAWMQEPQFFEARVKYLQLADKAARTVALLTERLDHHRGRGQQQITVKHVTTNNVTADQAIIADSVTTGSGARNVASPALLAASSEMPMPNLSEARLPDLVGVGGATKSK
jgi:hypothetical protein